MSGIETVLAGGLLVSGAGLIGWRWWHRHADAVIEPVARAAVKTKEGVDVGRPPRQIPILDAAMLFERTRSNGVVAQIRQFTALNEQNFEADVMPLLRGFAEYVQLIPASESHHHAQPGGLLEHTLEVAANALRLRQGLKLPLGATPEEQMRLAPVWSYGMLVAAVLHDIGKPVADVVIDLYGTDVNQSALRWNGLTGGMRQAAAKCNATHYTVDFPAQRDYEQHKRVGSFLLHALVPQSGLQWLSSDSQLMAELMEYLTGDDASEGKTSAIRDTIRKADSLSVENNLLTGTRTRFANARHTPLIERLMQGLRALVQEEHLAINRPGAGMFIDPDGQHAWIVSKIAADKTRELLDKRETRADGAAGLPTDNERLFDTWAEYGALVQTPEKKAVWKIRIEIGDWKQTLTVLKFPVDTLWKPGIPRPKSLEGAITSIASNTRNTVLIEDSPSEIEAIGAETSVPENEAVQEDSGADSMTSTGETVEMPEAMKRELDLMGDGIDLNAPPPSPPPSETGFLADGDDAAANAVESESEPSAPSAPVQVAPRALYKAKGSTTPRPNADAFMAWVQRGLGTGEIGYNEADAFVHFVPEGMAIVTPKAMKAYLEGHQFQGNIGASKDEWRALQSEIQKAGYVKAEGKSMFHKYRTTRRDGLPGATISCYLIPNPQAFIRPVPAPNEALARCEPESKEIPS